MKKLIIIIIAIMLMIPEEGLCLRPVATDLLRAEGRDGEILFIESLRGNKKIIKKHIKKVLLINAALREEELDIRPPLNIWYLHASLKEMFGDELEVRILDLAVQKEDFHIEHFITSERPDLVGISSMCSFFAPITYELSEKIRKALPETIIVAGGVHASVAPEEVVQTAPVDFVVKGEGIIALCRAIKVISRGDGDISKIKGIWYRSKTGEVFNTGVGEYPDMDDLPIIPSEEVSIEEYDLSSSYFGGERAWPLITERGCPMGCRFCSVEKMAGKKWRGMSAERIVREIKYIVKRFGITNFNFNDDSFTFDQNRARRFAELILADEELPPIRWKINARPDRLTEDLLWIMSEAGLTHISLGIESTDPVVLKAINKRMTPDQYKKATEWAKKYSIRVRYLLMLGLPFQDSKSVENTIEFLRETKPDEIFVQIYTPFPGSEFSDHPDKYGIVILETKDYTRYLSREYGSFKPAAIIRTRWMSETELLEARQRIIKTHTQMLSNPASIETDKRAIITAITSAA